MKDLLLEGLEKCNFEIRDIITYNIKQKIYKKNQQKFFFLKDFVHLMFRYALIKEKSDFKFKIKGNNFKFVYLLPSQKEFAEFKTKAEKYLKTIIETDIIVGGKYYEGYLIKGDIKDFFIELFKEDLK